MTTPGRGSARRAHRRSSARLGDRRPDHRRRAASPRPAACRLGGPAVPADVTAGAASSQGTRRHSTRGRRSPALGTAHPWPRALIPCSSARRTNSKIPRVWASVEVTPRRQDHRPASARAEPIAAPSRVSTPTRREAPGIATKSSSYGALWRETVIGWPAPQAVAELPRILRTHRQRRHTAAGTVSARHPNGPCRLIRPWR
jgi:hypothetical protein